MFCPATCVAAGGAGGAVEFARSPRAVEGGAAAIQPHAVDGGVVATKAYRSRARSVSAREVRRRGRAVDRTFAAVAARAIDCTGRSGTAVDRTACARSKAIDLARRAGCTSYAARTSIVAANDMAGDAARTVDFSCALSSSASDDASGAIAYGAGSSAARASAASRAERSASSASASLRRAGACSTGHRAPSRSRRGVHVRSERVGVAQTRAEGPRDTRRAQFRAAAASMSLWSGQAAHHVRERVCHRSDSR